ncbi:MAG: YiiX/YebB-like N1pC/P60 family cysteine hydrolase [Alphaproteobacteria bacterium]
MALMTAGLFWWAAVGGPSPGLRVARAVEAPALVLDPARLAVLQSGDLVFRRSRTLWGDIAVEFSSRDQRFSHVGIVYRDASGLYVIHAIGNPVTRAGKVRRVSLGRFLENSRDVGFYRLRLAPAKRRAVAEAALDHARRGTPFDADFSLDSSDSVYCTELIWRVVRQAAGVEIVDHKEIAFGAAYVALDDIYLGPHVAALDVPAPMVAEVENLGDGRE